MRAKELRDLSPDELRQKRTEFKEQRFHLTLRRATGQLESPMKLRQSRRDLARVETVLGEQRRAAEKEQKKEQEGNHE